MAYWAVVQTQNQREAIAEKFLKQAEFETYLPRIVVKKDAARERIVPLFPAYVFVRIVDQWWRVRWSVGVLRLIMGDTCPASVSDKIIVALKRREGENGLVKLPKRAGLERGQAVRIVRGSFAERVGIYDGMQGSERVRVLVNLMGRSVPVTLAPADIRAQAQL